MLRSATAAAFGIALAAVACSSKEDDAGPSTGAGNAGTSSGSAGASHGGKGGASGSSGSGSATGGSAGSAQGGGSGKGGTAGSGGSSGGAAGSSAGGSTTGGSAGSTSNEAGAAGMPDTGDLPEGDNGIAAKHPGDDGIAADSDVIFFDDFEDYSAPSELYDRWDAFYQQELVTLTGESDHVYAGEQALEFTLPVLDEELSDSVDKVLDEEQDVLFLRYYSRFEGPYDVVGSSHNGSSVSAHYFTEDGQATPGVPADGMNKFLANLENWRGDEAVPSPGYLNIYVYRPGQRSMWGDHLYPNGDVDPNTSIKEDWGPEFVTRPQIIPDLDRWYCYELMLKANTPGQNDGRIAFWLDGKLAGDFPNLYLRDIASLKINRFGLSFHINGTTDAQNRKWYDNVVAAKSYIGPRVEP